VESNFVAGVEHSTVSLVHAFKSRFESGVPAVTHVRVKGEETVLATFAEAEEVRLPMMKVLEWLDVDLDDTSKPGGAPRLAGASIEASLNYYNFHQAPGFEKQFTLDAGEVVCIMELELLGVEIEKGEGVSVEGLGAGAASEPRGEMVRVGRFGKRPGMCEMQQRASGPGGGHPPVSARQLSARNPRVSV
jgi:hypothetical protein